MTHTPVLLREVIDTLALKPGMTVLDGTVGLGGHATAMLGAIQQSGTLVGFDRDRRNLTIAGKTLGKHATLVHDSYANVAEHNLPHFDAALLDLGFSSLHVDDASRGFSFLREGPLDMRYDMRATRTAGDIVNHFSIDDLADIFRRFGEEPRARRIAEAIVAVRQRTPIATTTQLADIITEASPRRGKAHPATKVFQALRIVVNDELGELAKGLLAITGLLKPGARLAVITFHSLEDRVVKDFFRTDMHLSVITKKPCTPSQREIAQNPRSRSAKLRVAEKRA